MRFSGVCPVCQGQWGEDVPRKGRQRVYCSDACARRRWKRTDTPRCSTEGCNRTSVTKTGICHMCYTRVRRHGSIVPVRVIGGRKVDHKGYATLMLPDHPLTAPSKHGRITEHRVVLYEKLGAGPQHCFWCSASLTWETLVVDHLNEVKDDNRPDNLVASCNQCNRARGQQLYFLSGLSDASFAVFIKQATDYHNRKRRDRDREGVA